MKKLFTIFLIFISVFSFSENTEKLIVVHNDWEFLNLDKYTYLYSTKDTSLDIQKVLNKKFEYYEKGLNVGMNDKIWWEKLSFINPTKTNKDFVIYFPYSHINKIVVYRKYQEEIEHIASTGIYYGNKNRDSYGQPIHIVLKPGISTFYIYINHLYLPLRGFSYLLTKEQQNQVDYKSSYTIWFWRGFFLFTVLVTFALYLTTKLKIFLYYFILNIGVALFFVTEIGDVYKFLYSDPYNFTIDIKHLGNILVLIFFPLLINEITPVAKINRKIWKFLFYIPFPAIAFWLICLIPVVKHTYLLYFTTYYIIISSGIVFLSQLVFIFIGLIKKQQNALLLFAVYSLYISAVLITVLLPNLGLVENDLYVYEPLLYSSIMEILMFMILIARETLSIYNQRLYLIEEQKQHQTEVIKAIVASQEQERDAVGKELHDRIGANIAVIKQHTDKSNKALVNLVNQTIEAVRDLSHILVTPSISDNDFIDEINELCFLFSNIDIKIQSSFYNWKGIRNEKKATHLYRIIQELLQNAVKHSSAKNVFIQFIVNEENRLTVMYEDDGLGFDYEAVQKKGGLGLINISNRIKLMNASIIYDTQKDRKGTTITIEMQLEN